MQLNNGGAECAVESIIPEVKARDSVERRMLL